MKPFSIVKPWGVLCPLEKIIYKNAPYQRVYRFIINLFFKMKKDDLNQTINLLNKFIVSILEKCGRDSLTDNGVGSQNKETLRNNIDNSFNIYKNRLNDSLITLFPEKRIKTYTKVEDTNIFISNLNTYSALLDRLIAENIKLYNYNIDLNNYDLKSKKKKKRVC